MEVSRNDEGRGKHSRWAFFSSLLKSLRKSHLVRSKFIPKLCRRRGFPFHPIGDDRDLLLVKRSVISISGSQLFTRGRAVSEDGVVRQTTRSPIRSGIRWKRFAALPGKDFLHSTEPAEERLDRGTLFSEWR